MQQSQPPKGYEEITWLAQEDYEKAVGQLRIQLITLMGPLRMYGQAEYVDQAIPEIVSLCEDFGLRVRGIDKPISLELMRKEQYRKELLARDGG